MQAQDLKLRRLLSYALALEKEVRAGRRPKGAARLARQPGCAAVGGSGQGDDGSGVEKAPLAIAGDLKCAQNRW